MKIEVGSMPLSFSVPWNICTASMSFIGEFVSRADIIHFGDRCLQRPQAREHSSGLHWAHCSM